MTCPHTLAQSHLQKFKGVRSAAANEAEGKKITKYANLQGVEFIPFAVETLGSYGKEAHKFVIDIAARLTLKTGNPREGAYMRQRISIAIQKGNAKTLCFGLRSY